MRVPFRERDPRKLAIIGTLVVALVAASSLLLPQAVFYARTTHYSAEFANAAGLRTGDPVYIAGVPSGRVSTIELAGTHALVGFRMESDRTLGEQTTAGIKIQTVLGKRYLDLVPRGGGELDPDTPIPVARTSVPFSLDDLSRSAAKATEEIDLDALRGLLDTLEQDSPDPQLAGQALDGIARASKVFVKHDKAFTDLIDGAEQVTTGLLEQKDTLVSLLGDADLIASTLSRRSAAIGTLISDIAALSRQLESFLDVNRPRIESLLTRLTTITKTLKKTQRDFNATLTQFAPASRYISNTFGHGPWGDVVGPAAIVPDNVLCLSGVVRGCS
ncbi:MCE family protein [Haloechinothrix salitolerans]|uniref:MCE family protein n=1 Tax=Haloechinothrix salitolerans TaxID=926830 RepID=A0ABW2BXT9_9PSEU